MKKVSYFNQLTHRARRAAAWRKIVPASQVVQSYTGVIRRVGRAY